MFEHNNVQNETILRDVFIFWTWQHPKRSNSARLPHFPKLKTSKTKEFCETSFKNGKLSAELTASCQCVSRFFQSTCLKYCACHEKLMPYEALHLSRKIILANLHIWYQPLSGNQRPDLLTSLMNMSFVLRLPRKMHLCRSTSNVPCLPSFLEMQQNPHVLLTFEEVHNPLRRPRETHLNLQKWSEPLVFLTFWLRNVLRATTPCTFSTSQLAKVVRQWCVLYILTSKCASATTPCTFSTSQLPKAVRGWGVLYILTSKCASRHNGVQFFISHLASWLRTRRFSEPTFRPSGATNHWKTKCFAAFLPFRASASSFFWLFLFSDLLSSNLSLLSASALLCFSSVHIVGSLTSKLPSVNLFPLGYDDDGLPPLEFPTLFPDKCNESVFCTTCAFHITFR